MRKYDLQGRPIRGPNPLAPKPPATKPAPAETADLDPRQVLARYSPIRIAAFVIFQLPFVAFIVFLLADRSANGSSLFLTLVAAGFLIWNCVRIALIVRRMRRAGEVAVWIDGGLVRWEPGGGAFRIEDMVAANIGGRSVTTVAVSLRSREDEKIFALLMAGGATELAMTLAALVPHDHGWPRRRTPLPSTSPPPPV